MSATEAETGLGEWFAHPSLVRLLDKFRGFVSHVEDTVRKHQAVNKGHGHLLVDTLPSVTQCGGEHVLCVSCSSVRALQHRGRKEPHAGQSDTARPSTAVPMLEIRVAKTKNGPLEVLDPNTSDELDGSDLPSEYAVLDLTVSRSAQVSCANCRACGASGSMPRSRVLLYLTGVARLRGRVTWLLLSWMVSLRCFLCLFSRESEGRPAVLFTVRRWSTTSHRNSICVGWTLSARVGKTLVDPRPRPSTQTKTQTQTQTQTQT